MARRSKTLASSADKHRLYEKSVQCVEADVSFIGRVFKREFGKPAVTLREDFCGTAALCSEWVSSAKDRVAFGVDLDSKVLEWGRDNNVAPLGDSAERVALNRANVKSRKKPQVDVQVAFNFSYCIFKERSDLLEYFRAARASVKTQGMFIIDLHGGPESQEATLEETEHPEFTYQWEQGPFNPVNAQASCHIHFAFPDGSAMKRAFSYDWRIWSVMELRDVLSDAGFRETHVYWEGTGSDGEGNGVYRRVKKAENDPSYVSYIMALK